MKAAVKRLMGGVIISCQAYEDTPLYGAEMMAKMAASAILGGADGIRACWEQDIRAIRKVSAKPIIGIDKVPVEGNPLDSVFITPSLESVTKVVKAGADIVGMDCTLRHHRSRKDLLALLTQVRHAYPDIPMMADIATLEEGIFLNEIGLVDILSTTLSGYTRDSVMEDKGPDILLVQKLKRLTTLPVNAEGRIWDIADMQKVLQAGPDMVTIGSAVTRPHLITQRFADYNQNFRSGAEALKA